MDKLSFEEKRVHGSPDFPFMVYCSRDYPENYDMYIHWHNELEIVYQAQGSSEFHINDLYFKLNEGEVTVVPAEAIHSANSITGANYTFYSLVFNPLFLCTKKVDACDTKYLEPIIKSRWISPVVLRDNNMNEKETITTVKNIINLHKNHNKAYELGIKSSLFDFFYKLIFYDLIKFDTNEYYHEENQINKIKNALLFIHENYSEKTTINLLAKECNMSEYYFAHYFKKVTKMTPVEYLNDYRVKKACLLIKNSNLNIIDIAYETGFNNLSNFNRIFKKVMKVTPSSFRNV